MKQIMRAPALFFLILATAAYARITYTMNVASTNSITITNAQHGLNSPAYGVLIYNSLGTKQPTSAYSWTVDQTTYAVTVTFNNTFTGTVKLVAVYANFTSADQDFKVTVSSGDTTHLNVCSGCETSYAQRSYQSRSLTMDESSTLTITSFPTLNGYVYAYLSDVTLVYQIPFGATGTCTGGSCSVVRRLHPEDVPQGGITLGKAAISSSALGAVTDLRPF
jgi:hypothetical protein